MVFIQTACLYIRTGITDIRGLGWFIAHPGYVVFTFWDNLLMTAIAALIITVQVAANMSVIASSVVYTGFAIISKILVKELPSKSSCSI